MVEIYWFLYLVLWPGVDTHRIDLPCLCRHRCGLELHKIILCVNWSSMNMEKSLTAICWHSFSVYDVMVMEKWLFIRCFRSIVVLSTRMVVACRTASWVFRFMLARFSFRFRDISISFLKSIRLQSVDPSPPSLLLTSSPLPIKPLSVPRFSFQTDSSPTRRPSKPSWHSIKLETSFFSFGWPEVICHCLSWFMGSWPLREQPFVKILIKLINK